ncbi:WSC domain-containing protein, partial [Aureobasidium melanogenum]
MQPHTRRPRSCSGGRWGPAAGYAAAVASTDSYRDADVAQTGYLPNHNMDPAVVDSAQFGQLWKVSFNAKEQFYAKPLVFTPAATGVQILFLASSQNYIRILNAKTGAVLNTRQVHPPFLQSDIGCTDIPNTIGIIGTPVIDPTTEIAYFFSKTYIPNYRVAGNTGVPNGVYYFHGVYLDTLQDVPGFPILIDGSVADNDVNDYFVGGVVLQRPSLVQVGNYVYGGFGGHCDLFNYTGLVVGIDVVNKNIASQWAVSVGPLVPHSGNLLQNGAGGEGGIWQSGVGLSTDGSRLFLATGNGNADQNNGVPATGRSGCQTLGESVVNLAIDTSTGKLSTQDYFQPYDYENMDGGDQDFGSGGVTLLDSTVFKGTGVNRMAVGAGKNGKIYIMNADNLGGYKQGPGGSDGVVQTINTQKAVFGGSGSYPLEGGFLYSTPVGYPTYVYQLGFDGAGVPQFAQVASTKETSAGRVGVGIPTITSLNGQPGTAILWMTDPDAGIRAWYAVPKSDGTMKSIAMPQIQGVNKFQRPAFGDTRLYTTDASGNLYCLGSPVNLPLNCSSPVDFGSVSLGSSAKQIVNCTALININQITNIQTADSNFVVHLSDLPKGAITAGQQFSFPVLWNLTQAVVNNAVNASFGSTSPGFKSTPLTITTNNAVTGFATVFPISLTGKEISQAPFLDTTPSTVDFGGVILVGASGDSDGKTIGSTMTIRNDGLAPLVVTGYAWTQDEIDDDDVDWNNITQADDGTFILGPGFYATDLPPVNSTVNPSQSIIVDLVFAPNNGTGNYFSFFNIWTNGGVTDTILEGSASTAPIANMSISTSEHGWTDVTAQSAPVMDFGYVQAGTTQSLQIKICNEGGSVLDISKSKPPNGVFYISDPAELHEELQIAPNTCAYGTVLMSPPTEHYNQPDQQVNNTWTLNTDDLNFGVHVVQIQGVVQSVHVGPQNSTGNPTYTYLGCFQDNTNGKLLPNQLYAGNNNTNGMCQNLATPGGYVFTGTEYQIECYAGNTPPPLSLQVQDSLCNYPCAGNQNDTCGGNTGTGLISVFYDATRYTPGSNATSGPGGLPIPPNVGNFTYSGCWSDNVNGRALNGFAPNAPANGTTYESCAAACLGYEFFGVEYGNQCFCGNNVGNGAVLQASNNPDVNGCGMFCQGDSSEYCGGPNRMNVFQYNGTLPAIPSNGAGNNGNNNNGANPGPTATTSIQNTTSNGAYNYFGCWLDNVAGRALTNHALNGQTVGPDTCAAACSGYQYFGLEYGDECYCANTIGANSTVAPGGSNTALNGCNMACSGASNFTCGGPNRLSLYSLSANANITRIVDPVTVGSFGNWTYQGCYSEATNARALSQLQMPVPSANLTVQTCAAACSGYTYFGVEYASQCFCSNYISAGSSLVVGSSPSSTGCNMPGFLIHEDSIEHFRCFFALLSVTSHKRYNHRFIVQLDSHVTYHIAATINGNIKFERRIFVLCLVVVIGTLIFVILVQLDYDFVCLKHSIIIRLISLDLCQCDFFGDRIVNSFDNEQHHAVIDVIKFDDPIKLVIVYFSLFNFLGSKWNLIRLCNSDKLILYGKSIGFDKLVYPVQHAC